MRAYFFNLLISLVYGFLFYIIYRLFKFNKKETKIKYLLFFLFILTFFMLMPIVGVKSNNYINAYLNKKDIEITIEKNKQIILTNEELIFQFSEDPIKADKYYKNKVIQVIDFIYSDTSNQKYSFFSYFDLNENAIFFYFNTKIERNFENEKITIIGKYNNYETNRGRVIIKIENCMIMNRNKANGT